jgi:putative ABC transport system permease protein
MRLERWLYTVPLRLRSLLRRRQVEQELDEEFRYHLERLTEEQIAKGMSPEDARAAALRSMDGMELRKEECRDTRGTRWLEELWQDLRYGLRLLRRSPSFAAVSVITLGLGIGATTAIFTVVSAVLLRPLPYPEPDQLVYIKGDTWGPFVSKREFIAWRDRSRSLQEIAAYMGEEANFTGRGQAERVSCVTVTPSFFPLLGIHPTIGRSFLPEEDRLGSPRVVMLSNSFWKRSYGGDPSILGKSLTLDDKPYQIIGILPASFQVSDRYRFDYDFWMPLDLTDTQEPLVRAIGRLKPGVSLQLARSELDTILQSTLRRNLRRHAVVTAWQEEVAGGVRRPLLIFLGAVVLVLLIACVNVANLFLARAVVREREIVVRQALGAGRSRILRQLLTESILTALLGGALGLALAFWGKDLLVAFISVTLPTLGPIGIDYRVLCFTMGLAIFTGLAFGLAPAIQASRVSLSESLKEGYRTVTEGRTRHHLREILVVSEVALALVLLIGAGLLVKSYLRLQGVDPGFKADHILKLTMDLTPSKYPKPSDQSRIFQQVIESMRSLPGVQSAGACSGLALGGYSSTFSGGTIEGRSETFDADLTAVSPDYFRILGISLRAGRVFAESDREGMPGVTIVSESFVRHYLGAEDPLGKRIASEKNHWMTIVGVVADVPGYFPKQESVPQLYRPYLQDGSSHMDVILRTTGDPKALVEAIRSRIQSIDASQPPHDIMPLEQELSDYLKPQRINMLLVTTFASLALALASIGIYGVIAYSVSRRRHEIGVRTALGAQAGDIFRLVLGRGMLLVGAGLALGLAASYGLSRVITSLLYNVSATDTATFVAVALLFACVSLLTCYIPARQATKVDPIMALRSE